MLYSVNVNENGNDNVTGKNDNVNDNVNIAREKIEGLLTDTVALKKKIGYCKILEAIADNEKVRLDQISVVTGISKPTVSRIKRNGHSSQGRGR